MTASQNDPLMETWAQNPDYSPKHREALLAERALILLKWGTRKKKWGTRQFTEAEASEFGKPESTA